MLQRSSFAGKPTERLYCAHGQQRSHCGGSPVQQDLTSGGGLSSASGLAEQQSARPPRVPRSLFVTNDFPPRIGGAQSYYWGLIQTLDPSDLVIIAPDQPGSHDFDATHPYRVHRYPLEQLRPTRGRLAALVRPHRRAQARTGPVWPPASHRASWTSHRQENRSPLHRVPGRSRGDRPSGDAYRLVTSAACPR